MRRESKHCVLFLLTIGLQSASQLTVVAEQLFHDDFSEAHGPLVGTSPVVGGAWVQTGGNSSNPMQIPGGAAKLGTTGQDANAAFVSPIPIGSSYQLKTSFDLTVASVKPDEDYFLHLSNPAGSTTNFYQRLLIRWAPAGFEVGLLETAGTANAPTWSGQQLSFGTTYHFDIAWDTQPGFTSNISVEVDGAPVLQHASYGSARKPTHISAVNLRQGIASPVPSMQQDLTIDNLVVTATQTELAADNIFQWEYVDPADPALGKQTSSRPTGDGIGLRVQAGLEAASRNLARASLAAADLQGAKFYYTNLTNADLSGANLSEVQFYSATLTGADFVGADIRKANFERSADNTRDVGGTGIAPAQLYTTANYAARDLKGINFAGNNLVGADFSNQNLAGANFRVARLTGANFAGADVRGVYFNRTDSFSGIDGTGITPAQLYATASYQARDLTGISLFDHDFTGADLSGQNLTNVHFGNATLQGADFTGADIRHASFYRCQCFPITTGISVSQLESTASYAAHDLTGVDFRSNYLPGVNLSGQNLTDVDFAFADLTGANLRQATIRNTHFSQTRLDSADLRDTDLSHADLIGVSLVEADLSGANVEGARFRENLTLPQLYSTGSYQARTLRGIVLVYTNLSGGDFVDQDLSHSNLGVNATQANFQRVDFTSARVGGTYRGADFRQADFTSADLSGSHFVGADFGQANLSDAKIDNADFSSTNIAMEQLSSTAGGKSRDLSGIQLSRTNLAGANFTGFNLTNANFAGTDLTEVNLTDAVVTMANLSSTQLRLEQLYSTASYKAHDLNGIRLVGGDLSAANLAGQKLTNASLYAASLLGADLTKAALTGANLTESDLTNANLTEANFTNATLLNANLRGTTLTGANFTGANLVGANLAGADLRGTKIGGGIAYEWGCSRPAWGGCRQYGHIPVGNAGGINLAQLYTSASYAARDLSFVDLTLANLLGADFTGVNLTNAVLAGATLNGVDFTGANLFGADLRGATGVGVFSAPQSIGTQGQVNGLDIGAGQLFLVRDFDGNPLGPDAPAIIIEQRFSIASDGTMQMLFESDTWNSTITFAAGVPVALGGNLDLQFAEGTNLLAQIGRTFQLFNWTGVIPSGTFSVRSPYVWDLSKLYSTGEITFLAPSGLPGDFNGDAIVDAADFTYWRDNTSDKFTNAAFDIWKRYFGSTSVAGVEMSVDWDDVQPPAVPEPQSIVLVGAAIGASLAWRRTRLGGLRIVVLALFLIPCSRSLADAPHVLLTKVGAPIWKPVDFQLFSAPAAPFPDAFYHVIDQLVPLEGPSAVGYTPHAGPYDTELTTNALAAGFVNKSVFTPAEIDLQPNAVYLAFMIVPDPGITGSSRDFASGPVIPDATFPLSSNVDVWLDGVLVDFLTGSDYLVPVQGRDEPFDGTSHMDAIQSIWHPWDNDLSAPISGDYQLRWSMRDSQGSGWNIVASFRVVLPGDFNRDGSVDAADVTVWRDTLGSNSLLAADGDGNGLVDAGDYDVWKSNFGQTLGGIGAANAAVPEPATFLLCVLALGYCPSRWRRRSDFSGQSATRRARLLNSVSPG